MREVPQLAIRHFSGVDGAELAYREMGSGRPLVLIHGFVSTATVNWIRYGHAALLASRGYRVIMPDLRGHGDSAKPHEPSAYPPDVLADDGMALLEELELTDYDLGGYSLGGRTVVRMLVRGARPGRAVVAGMGLDGILHVQQRNAFFARLLTGLGTFERGSPEWRAEAFLKTVGGDPVALRAVIESSVDTAREALAGIDRPTLVVCGAEDDDTGSAAELAKLLRHGTYVEIPGNHMGAVTQRALGQAIADYLDATPVSTSGQ